MSERREALPRRVLPSVHRNVRRRILNVDAGEGTSGQPQQDASENVRGRASGDASSIALTPRRRKTVIRGIRRRMGGLKLLEINDYLGELEEEERRAKARRRTDGGGAEGVYFQRG